MEENNKQSKAAIIAVFSVLIIVIIALAGIVFFLLFDKIKEKNQGVSAEKRTEATEFKKKNERKVERETTDEETTEEMKEVENSTLTYDEDIVLDLDGFEFRIPADYGCLISETTGPVVYMSGVFQMKLAVVDTSYDEVMKDPDSLTEKVIEAGGTVTQDVTETELNGKKYAYYQMDLMGDKGLVVYTKAVDEEKRFAGQFVIESDSVTVDDLLHVFEQVTEKATVTDKPNSTDEDLVFPSPAPGEHKEESSLSIKAGTVTFKVPEGFYSEEQADNYNYDDYAMESFYTKNYEVFVDCQLKPVEDWGSVFSLRVRE